jgi:hypothetical protein
MAYPAAMPLRVATNKLSQQPVSTCTPSPHSQAGKPSKIGGAGGANAKPATALMGTAPKRVAIPNLGQH